MKFQVLLFAAFVFYVWAFAQNFFPEISRLRRAGLAGAGFLLHTLALVLFCADVSALPTSSPHWLVELIAWILAGMSLCGYLFGVDWLGNFPLAAAALLTVLPACCPAFFAKSAGLARAEGRSAVVFVHAVAAACSYALMFLSASISAAYLLKRRALKNRRQSGTYSFGISLGRLNRALKILSVAAAGAMAVSLGFGCWAAFGGAGVAAAKMSAGVAVFAIQCAIAFAIVSRNVKDAPLAKLCLLLFVAALAAFVSIETGVYYG